MIKNLNETLSILSLVIITIISLRIGFGVIFSSHLNGGTIKGNHELLKKYSENTEE